MKNFIVSRAFSKCGKSGRDLGGKSVVPIRGEEEVITTFS
jgi:hypothetical protein